MEDAVKDLIKEELEVARRRLEAAKLLLENHMLEDAINRAYYAVFYAAKAVLHSLGYDAKTHKGIISEFGLRLIKEGRIPKKYGSILRHIFEARESGDYEVYAVFDYEEVDELLSQAKKFVEMAEKFVQKMMV